MTDDIQNVRETTTQSGDTVSKTTETSNSQKDTEHKTNVFVRVVWYLDGIILVVLGLRFVLTLLGANSINAFANFIYNISHPLIAPFFSLFNYHYNYTTSHFETYTLVAMLVYTLIAWGIARLVSINQK